METKSQTSCHLVISSADNYHGYRKLTKNRHKYIEICIETESCTHCLDEYCCTDLLLRIQKSYLVAIEPIALQTVAMRIGCCAQTVNDGHLHVLLCCYYEDKMHTGCH